MNLTYETAKATLQKLAAERPDYVHPTDPKALETRHLYGRTGTCFYRFHDGTPGCIIGSMVAELFPDVSLREGSSATAALAKAGVVFDEWTRRLMLVAQNAQDSGTTWGQAVAGAIESVEAVAV